MNNKLFLLFVLVSLVPFAATAQRKGEAATIKGVEIKGNPTPGGKVTAVVKVAIEHGYHTHSNKPSEPQFIATALKVQGVPGVRVGSITYPPGKTEKIAGLEKPLSIYQGEVELSVPLGLTSQLKLPVKIPATLQYQACQGAQCYAPQNLKFEIPLGASGQAGGQ